MKRKQFIGFIVLFALLGFTVPTVSAQSHTASKLTKAQVRRFLKTEIAVDKLQKKIIKAHGYQLDGSSFPKKRAELLKSRGWNPDRYDQIRDKVFTAESHIRSYEEYKKEKSEGKNKELNRENWEKMYNHIIKSTEEMISMLKSNENIPAEQKQKAISKAKKKLKELKEKKEAKVDKAVSASRKMDHDRLKRMTSDKMNWPAVQPYLKELKQLTEWYNGNIPNPPTIK